MFILEIICWITLVISGLLAIATSEPFLYFMALITVALTWYTHTVRKNYKAKKQIATISPKDDVMIKPSASENIPSQDESNKDYNLFDSILDGNALTYQYEDNVSLADDIIDKISGHGGEFLKFIHEPQNEYDNKAIAIYLDDLKIGYVFKGHIQKMIHDWLKRDELFLGHINKISVQNNKVSYKIGFYRPLSIFDNKVFSLTKTSKKIDEYTNRKDNICLLDVGDDVTIELDYSSDAYVVSDSYYNEIGELGASAKEFIEDSDSNKIIGIVEDIDYDANDKPKVKVRIYLL